MSAAHDHERRGSLRLSRRSPISFSFQPTIDKKQMAEVATLRSLANNENVVLHGPPCVGKTQSAVALVRISEVVDQPFRTKVVSHFPGLGSRGRCNA